jgi:ATP-dependent helicase/nuclease subunit A
VKLTSPQRSAVSASGNVLVIAGAGTGKTRTLVERCLNCLLQESADLSEILVVTFTEAAAAEMRQRLRDRLHAQIEQHPSDTRAAQQLALFETAHIGTLHSFCLELVRRHFYILELDPQFTVMSEEEARLLANEELNKLLGEKYAEKGSQADAVRELIVAQGEGSDLAIRSLVLRVHEYCQTLPDPEAWMAAQREQFLAPEPRQWREWLEDAVHDFKQRWLARLETAAVSNKLAADSLAFLKSLSLGPGPSGAASCLQSIIAVRDNCPQGKKSSWAEPLKEFYKDAAYLFSLLPGGSSADPLAEDWGWVRSRVQTLLDLATEFTGRFSRAKRELALADFHDLEQYALRLLWDTKTNSPTRIAEQWRAAFRYVLVDEYQDINAAQDQILHALSREGKAANRFLVGDLKQSIYRFRLAAPRIFQAYVKEWGNGAGTVIPLVENFRSREGILDFINSIFELIMLQEVGGIVYDANSRLKFGGPQLPCPPKLPSSDGGSAQSDDFPQLRPTAGGEPRVELHLRLRPGSRTIESRENPDVEESLADLEEAAKEARLVALRLRELRDSGRQVWDEEIAAFRPVEWKDMAILLRAPSRKTEFYVREFSRLNVPLAAARGRFYESTEISDLISLLSILDNPLQDLPLMAVLRSPIVGVSLDDLANIRLANQGPFWTALIHWDRSQNPGPGVSSATDMPAGPRVRHFLERFARWRTLTRQMSLSACLEQILSETRYAEWLLTQSRGQERHANLQALLNLTRQFDRFQRQGLLRFLLFIESQRSADTEPPVQSVTDENAVRLMSIHQSKGLEFPIVVIADTGKAFNLADLRAEMILDEVYGIAPLIRPPQTGKRYPSLPYWLARRRQRGELLGEELRLLYVAMTRARDTLIITATVPEKRLQKAWAEASASPDSVASAASFADWLGLWFSQHARPENPIPSQGELPLARWTIHDDLALLSPRAAPDSAVVPSWPSFLSHPEQWQQMQSRLSWTYPFPGATREPAKSSVSALRRQAALDDEETVQHFDFRTMPTRMGIATGADAGTVTHVFLQQMPLDHIASEKQLRMEAARQVSEKLLPPEALDIIHFEGIARFWQSELGKRVQSKAAYARRELPFTVKFRLDELTAILGKTSPVEDPNEFVIVQGIADLVLLLPESIELLDFKTDNVSGAALTERAKHYTPQLKLYSLALSRIYRRPVSASWLYFLIPGEAAML